MATAESLGIDFDRVRVFPLPSTVLFPGVRLPLHVFEERYRRLVADAIASDGILAIPLLAPGWEDDYDGSPELHRVTGIGVIERQERLPDGRFNILVRGVQRMEILEEHPAEHYRIVRGSALDDIYPPEGPGALTAAAETARRCCMEILSHIPEASSSGLPQQIQTLADPSQLADIVASLFLEEAEDKQGLLETVQVAERLDRGTEILAELLLRVEPGPTSPAGPIN